jgi:hypothetical protein
VKPARTCRSPRTAQRACHTSHHRATRTNTMYQWVVALVLATASGLVLVLHTREMKSEISNTRTWCGTVGVDATEHSGRSRCRSWCISDYAHIHSQHALTQSVSASHLDQVCRFVRQQASVLASVLALDWALVRLLAPMQRVNAFTRTPPTHQYAYRRARTSRIFRQAAAKLRARRHAHTTISVARRSTKRGIARIAARAGDERRRAANRTAVHAAKAARYRRIHTAIVACMTIKTHRPAVALDVELWQN